MRSLRAASFGIAAALTTSLLLARAHPFGDATLYAPKTAQAPIMEHSSVPPEVRATLGSQSAPTATSTQTRPPIYGRFAPVSWLWSATSLKGGSI